MARLTVTDAARVAGVSRVTLHRAIKAGKLRQGIDSKIDTADLPLAGFSLHPDTLSSVLQEPPNPPPPATPETHATPVTPVSVSRVDYQGRYITTLEQQAQDLQRQVAWLHQRVETLEADIHQKDGLIQQYVSQVFQMLQEAQQVMQQQNQRLLDMPREVVFPSMMPQPHPAEPRGAMRQRITALLRNHPEGLTPAQVRELLHTSKLLRATMKAMARDGRLRRVGTGRYGLP